MESTKKMNIPLSTVTRDLDDFSDKTGNLYESVVIMGKRANQIAAEYKKELDEKLLEFQSVTDSDNPDEVVIDHNEEQIEVSKYYERQPKPVLVAAKELEMDEIHFRIHSAEKSVEVDKDQL